LIFALFVILPIISAINLGIEKKSSDEVLIIGLENPAKFDFEITNPDNGDNFKIYNLVGFYINPSDFYLGSGETKDISLELSPIGNVKQRGYYTVRSVIQASDGSEIDLPLTMNVIELKDAFEIGSSELNPESNSITVYIYNKRNFNFENLNVRFHSKFFDFEKNFPLGPYGKKEFSVDLNKADFKELVAGFYTLNAEINADDQEASVEGIINFVEKDILETVETDYGLIVSTKLIEKKNQGNTLTNIEIVVKKNIISRLFTSFEPEPDVVERSDLSVYYTWVKNIKPSESLMVTVKTNWLIPFLIVIFMLVIIVFAKKYTAEDVKLKKKVNFVSIKGGEFALKVSIIVQANNYVERINVIDKLPLLVKIYERFGVDKPSRIDEKNRRIEWSFEKLEAGEIRMLSYIIYSKVGVFGRFALPTASAVYERQGKIKESKSNMAFFVAEQKDKEKDY